MPAQAIRSDVIGSLLRPPELKAARDRFDRGELSAAALKQVEDRAVDEAVELQEQAGLDVVTDGELRRYAFFGHLIDALDGFDKLGGWAIPFHNEAGEQLVFKRPVVVEKLRWRGSSPDRRIDTCIEMDNAVIGTHPDAPYGLHSQRRHNQSMYYASDGY